MSGIDWKEVDALVGAFDAAIAKGRALDELEHDARTCPGCPLCTGYDTDAYHLPENADDEDGAQ